MCDIYLLKNKKISCCYGNCNVLLILLFLQQYWLHKYILHCEYILYKQTQREAELGDRAVSDIFSEDSSSSKQDSGPNASCSPLTVESEMRPHTTNVWTPNSGDTDVRETKSESHLRSGPTNTSAPSESSTLSTTSSSNDSQLDNMTTSLSTLGPTSSAESVAELRRRAWYEMFPENLINVTVLYERDDCITLHENGEN